MFYLLPLAIKNLRRHKQRSILTAITIAAGLSLYIFVDSMLSWAENDSINTLVNYSTASAQIMTTGHWEKIKQTPLDNSIEEPEAIFTILEERNIPYAPRISFSADLVFQKGLGGFENSGSFKLVVTAIDPTLDKNVFELSAALDSGEYLEQDDTGILLGTWLAEDMNARVGQELLISSFDRYGVAVTQHVLIKGILGTPDPALNRSAVYMSLSEADYFLDMEGAISQVSLSLARKDKTLEKQIQALEQDLDQGLGLYSYKELAKDFIVALAGDSQGTSIMLFLVFLISLVGIINTVLLSIFERTHEIGILKALGMNNKEMYSLFILESAGIGFIAGIIGIIGGFLANLFLVNHGIDYSVMMRDLDVGYKNLGIFYGTWKPSTFILAPAAAVIFAGLAALLPIRHATSMKIVEAMASN